MPCLKLCSVSQSSDLLFSTFRKEKRKRTPLYSYTLFCLSIPLLLLSLSLTSSRQTPPLSILSLPNRSLPPSQKSVAGFKRCDSNTSSLGSPSNLPIGSTVLVSWSECWSRSDHFAGNLIFDHDLGSGVLRWCCHHHTISSLCCFRTQERSLRGGLEQRHIHLMSKHPQPPPPNRMRRLRQHLSTLKHNTDILTFRVLQGIFVVFYVARLSGVDGVIASHAAVVAGEPFGAALAEDDVARDYVLFCFCSLSVLCS
jgi:hypothetical protein